jgi:hypothetical protein
MEAAMCGMDRVAIVGLVWFVVWTGAGDAIGHLFKMPGTGMVSGFLFALFTVLAWPWVMPKAIDDWMHDPRA